MIKTSRRRLLQSLAALGLAPRGLFTSEIRAESQEPLPVAAVVTEYRRNSHADVILGKILEGYDQQGGPGPALKLVGLYTDQVPRRDLSRSLAERFGFRIAETVDEALTAGTDRLQVAGVLSIGEHGDYPQTADTQQRMYPRRRFFDEIVSCFHRVGEVVPVFNDKHLAYRWEDARHMVDTARALRIPFLAGSSLPVTWRRPPWELPLDASVEEALVVGYGPLEAYGFHAIETLQCVVERRQGGETGVQAVEVWSRDEIEAAKNRGDWSESLYRAALATLPGAPSGNLDKLGTNATFFRLHYRDGLRATVAMANGVATQFALAVRMSSEVRPRATWFELQDERPYGHFAYLTRAIENLIQTKVAPYPVERTLLTTGVLDAVMHASAAGGGRRATPELDVVYKATNWPFANAEGGEREVGFKRRENAP
jgi:hypothetical protein